MQFFLQYLAVTDNHTQQIIEIVSNTSGEPAYGFHLLGLAKLFFQSPALRNIAIHNHQFFGLAFGIPNSAGAGFQKAPSPILVTHAVFDPAVHAENQRFFRRFLDLRPIVRMDLVHR